MTTSSAASVSRKRSQKVPRSRRGVSSVSQTNTVIADDCITLYKEGGGGGEILATKSLQVALGQTFLTLVFHHPLVQGDPITVLDCETVMMPHVLSEALFSYYDTI